MSDSVTVEQQVHFVRGTKGRKHLKSGSQTETPQRIPRIARLMALAIHFDELIRTGKVKDQSELARLGQVSTARISQIMGLLYLAPEIQEKILFGEYLSPNVARTDRSLRAIATEVDWALQESQLSKNVLLSAISSFGPLPLSNNMPKELRTSINHLNFRT